MRSVRGQAVVLFVLAALLSGVTLLRGIQPHDEGLMLAAAQRIAHGQWPYRDFWWNYGPGQPLLLAGFVKLLGPSLLWWRLLRVAVDATVALLVWALVRREAGDGPWALGAWLAAAGAMAWPTGPGPNPVALGFALGALLALPRRPGLAGALCGGAILWRPEIGLPALLAALMVAESGEARRRVAAIGLGLGVLLWLPFAIAGRGDVIHDTLGFLGDQSRQRLPFPWQYHGGFDPNKLLEFYLPLVLVIGCLLLVVWAWLRRPPAAGLALAPLILAGVLYLLGRTDEFHLIPLSVVLAAALAGAAAAEGRHGRAGGPLQVALGGVLVLIALHGLERRVGQVRHPGPLARIHVGIADGVRTDPANARAIERTVAFVRARVAAGQPIYVANPRHDLVRVGDPLLYVLADRRNPTRYDVMQPGVVTTAKVQREIVGDLTRTRPHVIIRWLAATASAPEPNAAGRSSGVRILDRWIAANYAQAARFGDYGLLVPRR